MEQIKVNNKGSKWTEEENNQMIKLYIEDKMNIIEIAKIHQRTPIAIAMRLEKNKIIESKELAKGYDIYIENKENIKYEGVKKTIDKDLHEELSEMKSEIIELKLTVKKLVDMLESLYEFE